MTANGQAGKGVRPVAVDLFAGAGGMSLGFERAGFDVGCAVEFDPIHCATHEFNFPMSTVICSDVNEVTGADIRARSGLKDRDIDVVFGGPPCQGFSLIGKRALDDPRNSLVGEFVRIALELRPKYAVMENVSGLTVGSHRQILQEVVDAFQSGGYRTATPYRVLDATDFGVPQRRRRLFLLAWREGQMPISYPEATSRPLESSGASPLPSTPNVWDALGDLPEAEDYPDLLAVDTTRVSYGAPSDYAARLRGLAPDPEDFSYPREYDNTVMTSARRTTHTGESRRRFAVTKGGETEPISRFRKLPLDGYCNTLRAGTHSNKGAFTSPRPIHPTTPRCITVREAARLHSYPDWFRFHVTKWHGFRQVGNSVPPLLAQAVAREIVRALGHEPTCPSRRIQMGDPALLGLSPVAAANRMGVDPAIMGRRTRNSIGMGAS